MGLDLLDAPVRLTWDFPDDATDHIDTRLPAIARYMVDAGVFFVTLQGTPLLTPAVEEVFKILVGRCQLLLNCRGGSEELSRLARLPVASAQLLLDASAFIGEDRAVDTERLSSVVASLRQMQYEPALVLTPLRNNLCNIPDLVRFCNEHEIAKFKLPNANIGDSFHDYSAADLPRWQDLETFRKSWLEFTKESCSLPGMEIHDLFLWEIMTPGRQQNRSEYGGCQAGNSLGHVDGKGVVHPCAAWPQSLGLLPDQSLEDVWAGVERLAIREHISRMPEGCHDCADLDICFGGCRGLAFHLNRPSGERDLMCPGPR